jgi:hypothetical protein
VKESETDLRVLESIESRRVDGSLRREVDEDVGVGVLFGGLGEGGVDGEEGLLCAPVELLDVVSAEGVDHRSDGGSLSAAREVEVEHALDGSGLETEDEGSGGFVEGSVRRSTGGRLGLESDDVVVGLLSRAVNADVTNLGSSGSLCDGSGGGVGAGGGGGEGGDGRGGLFGDSEGEGDDLGDVRLGTEDLDLNTKGLSKESESLKTLLVVGSWTRERKEKLESARCSGIDRMSRRCRTYLLVERRS